MAKNGNRELTVTALILGVLLAVVFGAANAYLGLRVGLTVSASVPAAVISMGVSVLRNFPPQRFFPSP